jgi:hypothetical protein
LILQDFRKNKSRSSHIPSLIQIALTAELAKRFFLKKIIRFLCGKIAGRLCDIACLGWDNRQIKPNFCSTLEKDAFRVREICAVLHVPPITSPVEARADHEHKSKESSLP